jgi:outer membrane protein
VVRGLCLVALGFWGWGGVTAAEPTPPLTLGEAVLLALKENPGLKATGYSVPAAEADLARARARFLPRLSVFESYNFSDSPSQVFMNKLNQRRFTANDFLLNTLNDPKAYGNFRTGVRAEQPLFQGGEALLGYQQARLKGDMAQAQVLAKRQQVIYQVHQAYFGRQLAEARLGVVRQAKEIAEAHRRLVESRYRSGAVVRADLLTAEVHLARLTQEELTAAGQVQVAKSALATALGVREVLDRPLAPAPREPAPVPANLNNLEQVAAERRPDLKRLELAAQVARKEQTKARLNYLPRVQVMAQYDVDQRRLFGSGGDAYTVMAVMHLNLFNGLADLARVREAQAQAAQARELHREILEQIRHQVTESVLNLKTAHARYQVAQAAVAQAREALRLTRLRYEEGLTILVDLQTAENAWREAELNRLAALFDTHVAQAGLELALGTLTGPDGAKDGK